MTPWSHRDLADAWPPVIMGARRDFTVTDLSVHPRHSLSSPIIECHFCPEPPFCLKAQKMSSRHPQINPPKSSHFLVNASLSFGHKWVSDSVSFSLSSPGIEAQFPRACLRSPLLSLRLSYLPLGMIWAPCEVTWVVGRSVRRWDPRAFSLVLSLWGSFSLPGSHTSSGLAQAPAPSLLNALLQGSLRTWWSCSYAALTLGAWGRQAPILLSRHAIPPFQLCHTKMTWGIHFSPRLAALPSTASGWGPGRGHRHLFSEDPADEALRS